MTNNTKQQAMPTNDGTDLVIESWLANEASPVMSPGRSQFTATCPIHGSIESSYESLSVGFAARDHADDLHGGLRTAEELLEIGPYIQI